MLTSNQFCAQVDKAEYGSDENPHGVGDFFGKIIDPFGPTLLVKWTDDAPPEPMSKSDMGVAPQPGTKFGTNNEYMCDKYTRKGCHVTVVSTAEELAPAKEKPNPKGKPKTKPAAKPKTKPAAKPNTKPAAKPTVMKVGATDITVVDQKAYEEFQKLSAQASHLRVHGEELDKTEYADKDTCAFEQAALLQKRAHQLYMVAIGLSGAYKSIMQPKKRPVRKRVPRPLVLRRSNRKTHEEAEEPAAKKPATEEPAPDKPTTEEPAPEEPTKEPSTWAKCRHPSLSEDQLSRLQPAIARHYTKDKDHYQPRYPKGKYSEFARRVCRAYVAEWKRQHSDSTHMNRENLVKSAVASVFGQIKPWKDKPHFGSTHIAFVAIMPVVADVLQLPTWSFKPGSKQWITKITKTDRYVLSYDDYLCCCVNATYQVALMLLLKLL